MRTIARVGTPFATQHGMEYRVGQYLALFFVEVASAVEYCHRLLPHVVPRPGVAISEGGDRLVVWFHVPHGSTVSTRAGCYLFVSPGAFRAAERARLGTAVSGVVPHSALPVSSVLVFGEDALDDLAPAPRSDGRAPPPNAKLPTGLSPSRSVFT